MGNNGCPFRIQPLIAVRVIEVPMRVDQVLDWIAAEAIGARMRGRDAVIPASMNTLPSAPVSTAMLPKEATRAGAAVFALRG
jgi:hypothetical protein